MMETKVRSHIGIHDKMDADVGIEVELESNKEDYPRDIQGWNVHNDGSLRYYGVEYVSIPLKHKDVANSLNSLQKGLSKGSWVDNNPRTSVHVHVNMLDYTPLQVWTLCTLYWMLEEVLFDICGNNRKGNVFCMRLCDAEHLIDFCIDDTDSGRSCFQKLTGDNLRYGALNLQSLLKFGTLEFRGMRGTLDMNGLVNDWVNLLIDIRDVSFKFKSPSHVLEEFTSVSIEDGILRHFSRRSIDMLTSSSSEWRQKIVDNYTYLIPFAYCQEWQTWATNKDKLYSDGGKYANINNTIRGLDARVIIEDDPERMIDAEFIENELEEEEGDF